MPKFKIRFVKEGVVERAPRTPGRGGFERDVIPVGTEMEVNDASLNFWLARGCVENLGRVPDGPPPPPRIPFTPFGIRAPDSGAPAPQAQDTKVTKAAIRVGLEAALTALAAGDKAAFTAELAVLANLDRGQVEDKIAELVDDSRTVLLTALEDAKTGEVLGNEQDIKDALAGAVDVLLPPSRRTRQA